MNMEDDIEKEIAELERAENEETVEEEEVVAVTEDGSDEELRCQSDGSMKRVKQHKKMILKKNLQN